MRVLGTEIFHPTITWVVLSLLDPCVSSVLETEIARTRSYDVGTTARDVWDRDYLYRDMPVATTYDHRLKRIGDLVRSAIHKLAYPLDYSLNRANRHREKSGPLAAWRVRRGVSEAELGESGGEWGELGWVGCRVREAKQHFRVGVGLTSISQLSWSLWRRICSLAKT